MQCTIEVIVSPLGEIVIEAIGFKGKNCTQATRFLEEALGAKVQSVQKPEYHQATRSNHSQQKVGP